MRRILMCPPEHYGVEYEITTRMSRSHQVDRAAARHQWEALFDLLRGKLGLSISLLTPQKGLPDLVFTANGGLVQGDTFVPSRFRHPERQREASVFRRWFEREGYRIRPLPSDLFFEGEGDVLTMGDELFAGSRIRADIHAHARISKILGRHTLSLKLVDDRFHHLDACFCPLADDAAAYYPPAFDSNARKLIEAQVPRTVEVSPREALRFACNTVVAGEKAVLPSGCRTFAETLVAWGFEVWETDLSEFLKAGGAAKCLVLRVDGAEDGETP